MLVFRETTAKTVPALKSLSTKYSDGAMHVRLAGAGPGPRENNCSLKAGAESTEKQRGEMQSGRRKCRGQAVAEADRLAAGGLLGTGQVLLCLILTALWDQHCDEPHFTEAGKSRKHLNTISVCTVSAEARPQTRSVSASSSRSPLGHLALEAGENALWRKRTR